MIVLAVVAAGVAVALLVAPPARRALHRLRTPRSRPRRSVGAVLPAVLVALACGTAVGAVATVTVAAPADGPAPTGTTGIAVGAAVALAAGTGQWLLACWRRRRAAHRAAVDIAHGCQVLAGQLRIGLVPTQALRVAAEDCPALRDGWAMHRLGGDVVRAWSEAGRRPGHDGLLALARAWQVAQDSGAPMAELLERVSEAQSRERRIRGVLESELAGPRATARLLALLPAAGVWLGIGLGGDPAGFLLHNGIGQICLVLAVALAGAGLVWVERIADQTWRRPDPRSGRDEGDGHGR